MEGMARAGELSERRDVEDFKHWIAGGFEVDQLGIRPNGLFELLHASGLNESGGGTQAGEFLFEEVVRGPV